MDIVPCQLQFQIIAIRLLPRVSLTSAICHFTKCPQKQRNLIPQTCWRNHLLDKELNSFRHSEFGNYRNISLLSRYFRPGIRTFSVNIFFWNVQFFPIVVYWFFKKNISLILSFVRRFCIFECQNVEILVGSLLSVDFFESLGSGPMHWN